MKLIDLLEVSPVIAAAKNDQQLELALSSECSIIFLLMGTVCDIPQIVDRVKAAGKTAIVHIDLIAGLGSREIAVDFIKQHTKADGIISTKLQLCRRAKEQGMFAILRSFVVDSMALENLDKQLENFHPDAVEMMPGVMPRVIQRIRKAHPRLLLIAGGLITDRKDVIEALNAGADAVSTTRQALWSA